MKGRSPPAPRIVVLAAGFSTRLGRSKAHSRVRGRTLLERTLAVLVRFAGRAQIIVVFPPKAARYVLGIPGARVDWVANRHRSEGLSSSVSLGLRRARFAPGVLFVPVDLAELEGADLQRLLVRWRGGRRRLVARWVDGEPGIPLILPRRLFAAAHEIRGDRGLREMARALPAEAVRLVDLPSAGTDVDTPADLLRARRRSRPPRTDPGRGPLTPVPVVPADSRLRSR